ncbi:MAG: hypothetical protein H7Y18_05455, partial [Clostridiaceae bacterium]|nr:hypothetical protein [Clostridiaceae bacterium]
MKIIEIERSGIEGDNKLANLYNQFKKLIDELRKKSLPDKVVGLINEDLKVINSAAQNGNDFKKLIKQKQSKIIKLVEKEAKIVPKNYYRNVWLAVG